MAELYLRRDAAPALRRGLRAVSTQVDPDPGLIGISEKPTS